VFKGSPPVSAEVNKTAFEDSLRKKVEFYTKMFNKAVHELFQFHGAPDNISAGSRISRQEMRVV
jgi:hypothetical protein